MNAIVVFLFIAIPMLFIGYLVSIKAYSTSDYINILTVLGSTIIIILSFLALFNYLIKKKTKKTEEKNLLPILKWSISCIFLLMGITIYWLIFYPTYSFSQTTLWNEEIKKSKEEFNLKWANASLEDLVPMGESIYLVHCSACHGVDAEGKNGLAHDLSKRISKYSVKDVIKNGSNNFKVEYPKGMPSSLATKEQDIEELALYIANEFKGKKPKAYDKCIACHGEKGEGIDSLGPNIKQYDDKLIKAVLNNGKKGVIGQMPSFKGRLNPTQEKALAAYIRSLSE